MHKVVIFTWNLQTFSKKKSFDYASAIVDHIVASVGLNVDPGISFVGTLLEIRAPKEKKLSPEDRIETKDGLSTIDTILEALKSKFTQRYRNLAINFGKQHIGGGKHTSEWIIFVYGNIYVHEVKLLSVRKFLQFEIDTTTTAAIARKKANVTSRSTKEYGASEAPERPREQSVAPFAEYLERFNTRLIQSQSSIKPEKFADKRMELWANIKTSIPPEEIREVDELALLLTNEPYAPWVNYLHHIIVDRNKKLFQLITESKNNLRSSIFGDKLSPSTVEELFSIDFRSINALEFTVAEKRILANQGYLALELFDWNLAGQRESVMKRQDPDWYRDGIIITASAGSMPSLKIASAHLPSPQDSNTTEEILAAFINACGMESIDVLIGDLNRYSHVEHSDFTDLTKDTLKTTLSADGVSDQRGALDKALLRRGCSWENYGKDPEVCAPPLKTPGLDPLDRNNFISDHALLKVVLRPKLPDSRPVPHSDDPGLQKKLKTSISPTASDKR